jgi:hypothetical protein
MHWCSGTVSSDAVQLSARSLAPGVSGSPTYSPIRNAAAAERVLVLYRLASRR